MRANEKYSGRGHARHLCKDCARLGAEELAYRQAVRHLERLLTWEGLIPHRNRRHFEKYLYHSNESIRAYAQELEKADAEKRAEWRHWQESDRLLVELESNEGIPPQAPALPSEDNNNDWEELPF
jgi:hypothetical protein